MKSNGITRFSIVAAIAVIYIWLRVWHLIDSCLWFDEIFSVHAAEHSFRDSFWFVAQDLIHPPLFYVFLKIWILTGGENLFWLRFFPVLFSILAIIPFLLLCRQLKLSFSTVAVAFVLFAVNGSLIKYAQEVRMYSLLLCLSLFSLWLFLRFVNMGKGFPTLIVINILLVYTHYFGWFVVASEFLAVLVLYKHRLKMIALMCAATFVSFTPWIYAVWQASKINADVGQNIGWMTKPNFLTILRSIFDLFEPIRFEQSNAPASMIALLVLPIFAVFVLALIFYWIDWKTKNDAEKRSVYLLSIFFLTPISMAFAASWISPYSIWGTRHLIVAFAPFSILAAIFLTDIKLVFLRKGSLILLSALAVGAFVFQTTQPNARFIWCGWEVLANNLHDSTVNGENATAVRIYTFEDLTAYHFWFALRDSDRGFQIFKVSDAAGMIEDKAYFLPRGFDAVQTVGENEIGGERFFIAFRAKIFDRSAPPVQNLIAKGYKIGEPQIFEAQGLKAFLVEVWK